MGSLCTFKASSALQQYVQCCIGAKQSGPAGLAFFTHVRTSFRCGEPYQRWHACCSPPGMCKARVPLVKLRPQKKPLVVVSRGATQPDIKTSTSNTTELEDSSLAYYASMLGEAHTAQEREEAASNLWQQSFESMEKLEAIGNLPGLIPPLVSLLQADTSRAAASAAGLLRRLAQVDAFRTAITEAGGIEGLVELLGRKGTPALVREQAVGALDQLSRGRVAAEKMVALGALSPVLSSLDSAMEEERLGAAGVVSKLASVASVRDELEEAGAVPRLVRLVTDSEREFSKTVRTEAGAALGQLVGPLVKYLASAQGEERIAGAAVLADLAKEQHQKAAIVASGAVDQLLTVLGNEESEDEAMRDVARQVMDELKLLTATQRERPRQIEDGYVGLFVRMLGLDRPIEDQEAAAEALWQHVAQSRENLEEVGALPGALPLLCQLMRRRERPAAAEAAAGVLRALANADDFRHRVYEAGGVEAALAVLEQWRHEAPEVRRQALGLLQALSAGRQEGAQIVSSEGVHLCVALLRLCFPPEAPAFDPDNPFLAPLQSQWRPPITDDEAAGAVAVLANLAASDANREPIASAGAIPVLARLQSSDIAPAWLRSSAKAVLMELAKQTELKSRFVEAGLVPVPLVKARHFSTVARSLGDSGRAPGTGAVEARKYKVLPRGEGVARLVLMLGLADPEPVTAAAEEIRDIAATDENRRELSQAGAVPMLVRLLALGAEIGAEAGGKNGSKKAYPEVARAAAAALSVLCENVAVRKKVEKSSGVEGLVWLLKTGGGAQRRAAARALFWMTREEEAGGEDAEEARRPGSIDGLIDLIVAGREAESGEKPGGRLGRTGKVVAAGGVPSLVAMLGEDSAPEDSEVAADILARVAAEASGAAAVVDAQVVPAVERLFGARVSGSVADGPDAGPLGEGALSDDDVVRKRHLWAAQVAGARLVESLARHEASWGALQGSRLHDLLADVLLLDAAADEKAVVSAALVALEQHDDARTSAPSQETEREIAAQVTIPQLVSELGASTSGREHAVGELAHLVQAGEEQEAYLAAIASNGGIFPLVDLLKDCSDKNALAALFILDLLTLDPGNHAIMLEAGAEEVLEKVARSNSEHWKLAMTVLRRLPI